MTATRDLCSDTTRKTGLSKLRPGNARFIDKMVEMLGYFTMPFQLQTLQVKSNAKTLMNVDDGGSKWSDKSVHVHHTTMCNSHLHTHRCENLKSHDFGLIKNGILSFTAETDHNISYRYTCNPTEIQTDYLLNTNT
jgi:hypothetical protein